MITQLHALPCNLNYSNSYLVTYIKIFAIIVVPFFKRGRRPTPLHPRDLYVDIFS
jgi:hypothetical protein